MSPRIGKVTLESNFKSSGRIADINGINEVTLASVANKLQIKTPSLYNHIDGLGELRKITINIWNRTVIQRLIQSTIGVAGDDAVRALGKAYITFARNHSGLYEATFITNGINDIEVQNGK